MRKILMIGVVLLAICISISAVSADDDWSFSFSSSENTDGGSINFDNGLLKIQDLEFNIPEGYEENESAQKLAEDAADIEDAKYSACQFIKDGKEIVITVFFTDAGDFENLTATEEGAVEKTIAGINGIYSENSYGDNTPTFKYLKDGKIVMINAPDDDTIASVIK